MFAECFMNLIAIEDLLPNGGLPIIWQLQLILLLSVKLLYIFKKFAFVTSICSGFIS